MSIRWRLAVVAVQLALLSAASLVVAGSPVTARVWFLGGMLAIVINPQLLEPFYPRPTDVLANVLIFLLIFATGTWEVTRPGWLIASVLFGVGLVCAVIALWFGANRSQGRFVGSARFARGLSQLASSRAIYSVMFFLDAIEFDHSLGIRFWLLSGAWLLITAVGLPNWQSLWQQSRGGPSVAMVHGMIGPSIALVSAPWLPEPGSRLAISRRGLSTWGIVISRIRRLGDVWGQIHVKNQSDCEAMVGGEAISLAADDSSAEALVGSVDAGSTDRQLACVATRVLEVGEVVAVPGTRDGEHIIYQVAAGGIERLEAKGGSQLLVRLRANQLGMYDDSALRLRRHRWVPSPGAPVWTSSVVTITPGGVASDTKLMLGHVIGTAIPITLDLELACEGHMAILGMTKMGKSTLAERIASRLAQTRRVTVLDMTGEYVAKKGFPPVEKEVDWRTPGISVLEPKPGEVPAKRAHEFFESSVKQAVDEYKAGTVVPRSIVVDEAHQFIPEPAGLGFNAPGRDDSYAIGILMMQIRKYGISVMLISQRTAVVAKSALSQCENVVAFRSVDQTGLDYLEAIAGQEVRGLVPQLRQGEALAFGPAISSDGPVAITVLKPTAQSTEPAASGTDPVGEQDGGGPARDFEE